MNHFEIKINCDELEFITAINKARLANKNQWYVFNGVINNCTVKIKGYGTWLQILEVNGFYNGGCPDINVKRFKEVLANAYNSIIKRGY